MGCRCGGANHSPHLERPLLNGYRSDLPLEISPRGKHLSWEVFPLEPDGFAESLYVGVYPQK